MKLNLGCGQKRLHVPGWINIDCRADCQPDLLLDLTRIPWLAPSTYESPPHAGDPFPSSSVDALRADNLLEHFDNDEFLAFLNEAHRALRSGGVFWYKVPDALRWPDGAYGDPTHKRFFVDRSFLYFNRDKSQWREYGRSYGFLPWRILSLITDKRFFTCEMTPEK